MNIATLIQEKAKLHPHKPAVMLATPKNGSYVYPFYTFLEFEKRSQQIAARLSRKGVHPGARVLLFVRPSLDFSVITFALFKLGAIPVLIDPGMGRKNLLRAIEEVKPEGLIGVNLVHILRRIFSKPFASVKWFFSVEKNLFLAPELLKDLSQEPSDFKMYDAKASDPAAILFTSGGTGTPKGVITTHGILTAQTHMLQAMFSLTENDVDLPGFPLFALFTLAMGMTSVIPDMDPTKPAQCEPAKIVQNLLDKKVTFAAGSPAIWERVGKFCKRHKLQLPDLKYVVMFGAPVRGEIHELWRPLLPDGTTYTPYGATECLPVTVISGREVLDGLWEKTKSGGGTCIGQATPLNQVFIISASDIPKREVVELPRGEIGEIVVLGPTVTPGYFDREEATKLAKIQTSAGLHHRMGDVGWMDEAGRVWFCGRKAHVVILGEKKYYPIPVEAIFNQHPAVRRSALVALVDSVAVVVELHSGFHWSDELKRELRELALKYPHTHEIMHFFSHPAFPVDVRHNIKIDRVALSNWAKEQI